MRFTLSLLLIAASTALNGCAARVMSMPAPTSPASDSSASDSNFADSSPAMGSPSIDAPTEKDTIGTSSVPTPAPSDAPAFLAEKPVTGNSGEVSFLIDAPAGSTATCSLDRNDPIACGMSFTLDPVSSGDHTMEIVVLYPNGESVTLEHDWSQVAPTPSPSPATEGADPGEDSDDANSKFDSKKHRKGRGHGHEKDRGKSGEHRRDGNHGHGKGKGHDHDSVTRDEDAPGNSGDHRQDDSAKSDKSDHSGKSGKPDKK